MALVARLHSPVQVFLGALLGLWASAVIAVVADATVGKKLDPRWLRRAGGLFFLGFALWTALTPAAG
jgi:putative Ca2+/H+ antiporter (TMEM165/GDT1 family)